MRIWKQLVILAVLAGLAYGGYAGYHRYSSAHDSAQGAAPDSPPSAAPVEVAMAENRTMKETVEAVGTTRARQSIAIVPETNGRIEELAIFPGQRVEKGDVLIRLDDVIARADVAEAEALLLEHERAMDRVTRLRGANAVAEATLEETAARLAEARARMERAQQRLTERAIRAPFAGVVGLAEVDVGARVSAGSFVTRLDDLSEVELEFSLPETLFAQIRTGQNIKATSAAFPERSFAGQIDTVDSKIDPISRSFRIRAVIPNPDETLPSGMFMSLELTLSQSDRVTVPEEAIVFQAAETYVFAVIDGIAQRKVVKSGQRRDGMVALLDGLEAGTPVVVRGLHRVRNGVAVDVLNPSQIAGPVDGADS